MTKLRDYTKEEILDSLYTYRAVVTKIVDGDTVYFKVDQGFYDTKERLKVRFARIDAPEPRGETREAGKASTAWLKTKISVGDEIIIRTKKDPDSWERYICELFIFEDGLENATNLNDALVKVGHAIYKTYK